MIHQYKDCFMNNRINYWQLFLTFITVMISSLFAWWLNSNSKRKEIKLVNYHKEQIDKTTELFSLLADFDIANELLFLSNTQLIDSSIFKERINRWNTSFTKCYFFYRKNRILFPNDQTIKLNEYFVEFRKIRTLILNQKKEVEEFEEFAYYNYQFNEEENEAFNEVFDKLRSKFEIKDLRNKSTAIQANIELYFNHLVN